MKSGGWIVTGVKGMADVTVIMAPWRTAFVEVKTGSGEQEPDQKAFEAMVKALGFPYFVARNIEDTIKFLDTIASGLQPRQE